MLFAVVAALVHGAAIGLLLPHGALRPGTEAPPVFEVELVDQAPKAKGTSAEPAPAPPQPPSAPPPAPQSPPPPPQPDASLPLPPPPQLQPQPPQPQPAHDAPPGPAAPPRTAATAAPPASVNLAGSDEDQEGLRVSGPNVVPPRPDALFHNKPPSYPIDAVRRHAEGTVALRIHVTENGTPGWVDVISSSGDQSLDQAAREAVALWRFQPAREHGVPVATDMPMTFSFTIDRAARALP